MTVEGNHLGM